MEESAKAACCIHHYEDAMQHIREAGEMIAPLVGFGADQAVTFAVMDLEFETSELLYEFYEQRGAQTVRDWLEPKRDVLLAHLKQRGVDTSEDALGAFRKIEEVLKWVDAW